MAKHLEATWMVMTAAALTTSATSHPVLVQGVGMERMGGSTGAGGRADIRGRGPNEWSMERGKKNLMLEYLIFNLTLSSL